MNHITTPEQQVASPVQSPTVGRFRRARRALRVIGYATLTVLVLSVISAVANAGMNTAEHSNLTPYGQKVHVPAGDLNVYRTGGPGPTLVFLSGYGTVAPAIDFAPLIRKLPGYDIIVVEGFGYGYSDLDVKDRTVENITTELHDVLTQLKVDSPYVLVAHSISGIYAHYYANAYPGEVSAIVGIDPTPAKTSTAKAVPAGPSVERLLVSIGVLRWVTAIAPDLVEPKGAFTSDELARIHAMTNWNYANPSIADEWNQIGPNATKANAIAFPTDVPVLEFIASESVDTMPGWLERHEAELANVAVHKIEVVEGAHYLHWTQSALMATEIDAFLKANLVK
jgi:pimeloyl-ACP methyl ester carboxylesterase